VVRLVLLAALLGVALSNAREERWREDIAVARREFLAKDLSFTPDRRRVAERRLDRLATEAPSLTDQEIVAELARVAALAENPHTRAYLLRNRGWWRRYPIRIWKFGDGWRVIATAAGHEHLLGARIVGFGRRSVRAAEEAVRPLYAGPASWRAYMASYSLTSPDALLGTRVIAGDGAVDLAVEKDGRWFTVGLAPVAGPRRAVPEESWWFLSASHPAATGWAHVLAGRTLPPYLDRPGDWYDLRRCDKGVLYLSFSRAEDQPGRPTLAAFGTQVLERIAQEPDSRLVIDLRFKTGGNLQKTLGLFRSIARSRPGQAHQRLFVILGPTTFSAGITPAAILKEGSKAVIVGSEPGDRLRFWAEGGNVLLPNSGINLHFADRVHDYSGMAPGVPEELVYLTLKAGSLRPDLPVTTRFADYLAGRDPVTERVLPGGLRCGDDG
jgi:hypothetical protein